MANIKDLKVRIQSTKNTLKITSAMKLVSAAKLSRAQGRITGFKPYSSELDQTVRIASALAQDYSHEYLEESENQKAVLLVVSSEKGLCGGYNNQLFKKVKNFLNDNKNKDVKCYFIGRKVKELLLREGIEDQKTFKFKGSEADFSEVKNIVEELTQMFTNNEVGSISVAYNSFISAIEFDSKITQVLPMSASVEEKEKLAKEFPVDFIYEPSAKEILDKLIPEVLVSSVYSYILDAVAAEHAARMAAMDNATKNSQEMVRTLTLTMNKLRQAAITTELTEIVSGAESLNS
ncbi:MAG: ATP synthase F1 subunit gamma [Bacteriovoracaceae bacterium]|jgi:F-type H+-transporting ATPase subunit gamma|nr:ATP synthase F1 subunit gamma [Bacteriovoracaceae bacterium]